MRRAERRDDTGASAVEYSMIVAAIAAVLVLALLLLGRVVSGTFGSLDCWTATGCTQSMPSTQSPAPASPSTSEESDDDSDSDSDSDDESGPAVIPASAYAANPPAQVCNNSGNGNGKGKGKGSCDR